MKPYYDHGGITIFHGDCREIDAWRDADVMVTDPPYGMAYKSGWSGGHVANDDSTDARDQMLALWGAKPALVFGRWSCPRPAGLRALLIWDKGDCPGMGDLTNASVEPDDRRDLRLRSWFSRQTGGQVVRSDKQLRPNPFHPTEKPVRLIRTLLERCPPGVVADPFMGAGSTLVAAKELGRRAIGIEIEERYCEIAAKRLAQETLALGGAR